MSSASVVSSEEEKGKRGEGSAAEFGEAAAEMEVKGEVQHLGVVVCCSEICCGKSVGGEAIEKDVFAACASASIFMLCFVVMHRRGDQGSSWCPRSLS